MLDEKSTSQPKQPRKPDDVTITGAGNVAREKNTIEIAKLYLLYLSWSYLWWQSFRFREVKVKSSIIESELVNSNIIGEEICVIRRRQHSMIV